MHFLLQRLQTAEKFYALDNQTNSRQTRTTMRIKTSTHLSLSYTMFSKFDDSEIPFADGFLDVVETDTHRLRLSLGSLQRGSVGHHHHSRTTDHDNIRQGLSIVCPAFSRVNILDRLRTGDMPSCSQVSCCLAACALSPARAWRWPPLR